MRVCDCLKRFYEKPVSTTATALWLRLWYLAIYAKENVIKIDNQTLMQTVGIKKNDTLKRAREELVAAGLISYKAGRKGCMSEYVLLFGEETVKPEAEENPIKPEEKPEMLPLIPEVVESVPAEVKPKRKRLTGRKPKYLEGEKKQYGEYGWVWLTDGEIAKINELWPGELNFWIQKIDGYIQSMRSGSKKRPYDDVVATIRNWKRNEQGRSRDAVTKMKESMDIATAVFNKFEFDDTGSDEGSVLF